MVILAIDTSCDETSASILKDGKILSNIIFSQQIHKSYGGVVPSLASKDHEKNIYNTVLSAIYESEIDLKDIDYISATFSPGLITCLLVGLNFAKGLAIGLNKPFIPINHLEGHLCSNLINNNSIPYPYICLLVSGGHTQIWIVDKNNNYEMISTTLDDAAGEAFDKGAKMLGLEYPGGPEIEKYSKGGRNNAYQFSIPKIKSNKYNFSFSGIKTALYYIIKDMSNDDINRNIQHLCASYQEGILNILFNKIKLIIDEYKIYNISIVGGVACNKRFRELSESFSLKENVSFYFPDNEFCTDNAAMIATACSLKVQSSRNYSNNDLGILPIPNTKF